MLCLEWSPCLHPQVSQTHVELAETVPTLSYQRRVQPKQVEEALQTSRETLQSKDWKITGKFPRASWVLA